MFDFKISTTSGGLTGSISPKELSKQAQSQLSKSLRTNIPLFEFLENGGYEYDAISGKKVRVTPPDNPYRDWKQAQYALVAKLKFFGENIPEMEGWRTFFPDEVEEVMKLVDATIENEINPHRDRLVADLDLWIDFLIDREDAVTAEEIRPILERASRRFDPDVSPHTIWRNQCKDGNVVMSEELERKCTTSELNGRKSMISEIEDDLIEMMEAVTQDGGIKRLSESREKNLNRLSTRLGRAVSEFSEFPEKVERFEKAQEILKNLPTDRTGIKSDDAKTTALDVLDVFKDSEPAAQSSEHLPSTPDEPVVQDSVFENAHFEDDELVLDDDPIQSDDPIANQKEKTGWETLSDDVKEYEENLPGGTQADTLTEEDDGLVTGEDEDDEEFNW